jgi:hypothetical protein
MILIYIILLGSIALNIYFVYKTFKKKKYGTGTDCINIL